MSKKLKSTYRPLPDSLTISPSEIEGLGLHTVKDIEIDINLGISHVLVENEGLPQDFIRSPLGGFINHSVTPNCVIKDEGKFRYLITSQKLFKGEELTVDYRCHKCGQSYVEFL